MTLLRFRMRAPDSLVSVGDWRALASRRLPQPAWTYVEGGADDLVTLSENMTAFRNWRLRTRVLVGGPTPDLRTNIAGTDVSLPVAIAPTGGSGACHWTGDVAIARAAEEAGTRLLYSSAGSYTPEEVATATEENHWFQLYAVGSRAQVGRLIERASAAGYSAMFVTVDGAAMGNREGERKWPFRLPWTLTPKRLLHLARHGHWVWDALRHNRLSAINFLEEQRGGASQGLRAMAKAAESTETLRREIVGSQLDWDMLAWIRDRWKGPLYVKGVLDADDAARSVDVVGVDGIVVSNHGGRQLDRCLASIEALPAIVDRVGDRAEIYLDGGVRRGTDVVTALCLGARAVFIGRPALYGLAAAGEAGVLSVIEIFRDEIERALRLMGCASIGDLHRGWLVPRSSGAESR